MNKENKQKLYTSPEVEVIEVKARQVICTSMCMSSTDMPVDDPYNF